MTALLIVLAVLLLIGFLPAGVKLRYDDGDVEMKLKLGPFRVPLLPARQPRGKKLARRHRKKIKAGRESMKKRAEKRARNKKKKEEEKRKPKEQRTRERLEKKKKKLSFEELMQFVSLALEVVGKLPRKLMMNELYLHVTYSGSDAARAAIGYGRAWAVVGSALPVLERAFRIRKRDVGVDLDYGRESLEVFARLDVHMLVGTAALLAFGAGFRALKLLLAGKIKRKMKEKEV